MFLFFFFIYWPMPKHHSPHQQLKEEKIWVFYVHIECINPCSPTTRVRVNSSDNQSLIHGDSYFCLSDLVKQPSAVLTGHKLLCTHMLRGLVKTCLSLPVRPPQTVQLFALAAVLCCHLHNSQTWLPRIYQNIGSQVTGAHGLCRIFKSWKIYETKVIVLY